MHRASILLLLLLCQDAGNLLLQLVTQQHTQPQSALCTFNLM
jgi:hypothetical protein